MDITEYAPGRAVDVFGASGQPTVLLWHGMQTDARAAVRPLAELIAGHGPAVLAPDWDSYAADGGCGDLLASAAFGRERAGDADVVLVGWSLGGTAAAGMALGRADSELRPVHTVTLGGAFTAPDPLTGRPLTDLVPQRPDGPMLLLHGRVDDVVPVAVSRDFAAHLTRIGRPVRLAELDTDHAAIAGARYDAAGDRYLPAEDPDALAVTALVAAQIAGLLSTSSP